jgi:hypothetical protein
MYSHEIELFFPPRLIPTLKNLRGNYWRKLIDQIIQETDFGLNTMAFLLFMVRLNGCLSCSLYSYKAMRGCHTCASVTIARFPGNDRELMRLFDIALRDIEVYIGSGDLN